MNCQTIGDNLSAYLDKALPPDEMREIEKHLSACPECRQELAELQKTINLLASLDEVIPPASFRRDLRKKLEKNTEKRRFTWSALRHRLPRIRNSAFAPVAVVMILFIVAIPFALKNAQFGLGNAAKSELAQDSAGTVRGVMPEAPEARNKVLMDMNETGRSVDTGAVPADGGYDLNGKSFEGEALMKGAPAPAPGIAAAPMGADTGIKTIDPAVAERKIIKNADLRLQVDNYETAVEEVKKQVASLGGYIAGESVNVKDQQGTKRGNIQIRMPYQQFEAFLDSVEVLGKVQNRNIYTQDVTEEFVDLESRLKAMQTKEERLLAILQKAGQLADVLAVENELANTRAQLESLQGRLRFLNNRVDYSSINMSIDQVVVPTQTISAGGLEGVLIKAKEAFIKAINNILLDMGKLVVWISSALPYLLVLTALVYIFWRWARKKMG